MKRCNKKDSVPMLRRQTDDIMLDDLTELVSESTLQQVQDAYSVALGIPILFVSASGRLVTMSDRLETFCWKFTRHGKAKKPCNDCDRHEQQADAGFQFTCPMDLNDIAFPINAGDTTVGYLITAQVSSEPGAPKALDAALESGMPAPKAVKYVSNIPVFTPDWKDKIMPWLHALASLVSELATATRGNLAHSIIDSLTGLANRNYFWGCLARELETAKTHNYPVSVLLADLDGFKNINSIHGHVTGDRVLRAVGQILEKEIRTSDLVARYTGDSFLVMLRSADQTGAEMATWRLGKRIAECEIISRGQKIPISAHFGIASYPACGDLADPDTMFKLAFEDLCKARESSTTAEQQKAA